MNAKAIELGYIRAVGKVAYYLTLGLTEKLAFWVARRDYYLELMA